MALCWSVFACKLEICVCLHCGFGYKGNNAMNELSDGLETFPTQQVEITQLSPRPDDDSNCFFLLIGM